MKPFESTISDETIRAALLATGSARQIASTLPISAPTVAKIKRLGSERFHIIYGYLMLEAAAALRQSEIAKIPILWGDDHPKPGRMTPEMLDHIRTSPKSSRELSEEMGCSASMIRMIKTGRAYNG